MLVLSIKFKKMAVITTVVMKLSNIFTLVVNDSKCISKIPRM